MDLNIYQLDVANETEYAKQLTNINRDISGVIVNAVDFKDGKLYILSTATTPISVLTVSLYPVKSSSQQTTLTNYIQSRTVSFFKALENDIVLVVT
jgi:hypothetical protein